MKSNMTPSPENARARNSHGIRDRVLLYLTGVGMNDVASLELAAECLRRAGPDASAADAMAVVHALLEERGLGVRCFEPGARRASFPPLVRKTMISSWTSRPGLYAAAKNLALRIVAGRRKTPPPDSRRKGA